MSIALSPLLQAQTFLLCLALGGGLGLLYDLLRLPRVHLPFRPLGGLLDLLFWLSVCLTLFLIATFLENGQVRLYTLAALTLGAGWYFLLLSPLLRRLLDLVTRPFLRLSFILLAPLTKTLRQVNYHWSKDASLMLKAEVYLWSAKVTTDDPKTPHTATGSTEDLNTAKSALSQLSGYALESNFSVLFSNAGKLKNSEVILSLYMDKDEANSGMYKGYFYHPGFNGTLVVDKEGNDLG